MFAARFDPNSYNEQVNTESVPIIPIKRVHEDDDDNDSSLSDDEENNKEEASSNSESESEQDAIEDNHDEAVNNETSDSENLHSKHHAVLSRFQQTISLQDKINNKDEVADDKKDDESNFIHDIAPIPQPEKVKNLRRVDTYEHKLTAWKNTTMVHYKNSEVKAFSEYSSILSGKLLANIENNFSKETFPIQASLLDNVLSKLTTSFNVSKRKFTRHVGDLLVNASTGSGKTLAYSIPIVHVLQNRVVNKLRAIVLVPTKILIHQVYETMATLTKGSSLIVGVSKIENSLNDEYLKFKSQEPDILVITPGRLVDHLQLSTFSLKNLKFLVLDEADRLLNQSFQNWCTVLKRHIKEDKLDKNSGNVIKMVFSATLTTNTEKLHSLQLHDPTLFLMDSIKLYTMPKQLQEYNLCVPTAKSFAKPLVLLRTLSQIKEAQVKALVFVKSNEASLRLAALLQLMLNKALGPEELEIFSINNNKSPALNKKLISAFSKTSTVPKLLISTDVMSRGVDITNITHVINYDPPISSQQYVHRCGRTARANTSGTAINILVGKGELKFWQSHIDTDLNREPDGCQAQDYTEEFLSTILNIDEHEKSYYEECLDELKRNVLSG
ncbi:HHL219Wp [Eremothecium sinecaudum]|uniref:ATP-dependent RNA helicase n=1 Tax=Eremothecium sinecaudum TaxID=45286 RepID=A0A0X8HW16_9SACH|nr:HHL219Wp [Eremothecium sinecaudum]AMD22551.1 HHL219Wp [Eremothecium sinecaudum]